MPGVVKIGMTMRSPTARAEELSRATGVPEPFTVIYYAEVEDPFRVEAMLHSMFANDRVSGGREFFTTNPADISEALYETALSCWMDSVVADAVRDKAAHQVLACAEGRTLQ